MWHGVVKTNWRIPTPSIIKWLMWSEVAVLMDFIWDGNMEHLNTIILDYNYSKEYIGFKMIFVII